MWLSSHSKTGSLSIFYFHEVNSEIAIMMPFSMALRIPRKFFIPIFFPFRFHQNCRHRLQTLRYPPNTAAPASLPCRESSKPYSHLLSAEIEQVLNLFRRYACLKQIVYILRRIAESTREGFQLVNVGTLSHDFMIPRSIIRWKHWLHTKMASLSLTVTVNPQYFSWFNRNFFRFTQIYWYLF